MLNGLGKQALPQLLMLLSHLSVLSLIVGRVRCAPQTPVDRLYRYPTDLTRGVVPKKCHSHNDYWKRIPLWEAIAAGCTGVEADVWLFHNELYVGHDLKSLTDSRTFANLYVKPLVALLDQQNPRNRFESSFDEWPGAHGVFNMDPNQSLVLLIEFKNDGRALWPVVEAQLEPLRRRGYLTHFNGTGLVRGPVVAVATGLSDFRDALAQSSPSNGNRRDIFYDAPLELMYEAAADDARGGSSDDGGHKPSASNAATAAAAANAAGSSDKNDYNLTNSYYASTSFVERIGALVDGKLSSAQKALIRGYIKGAHRRGLKARFWGLPHWPKSARKHVWKFLLGAGLDYLVTDDLSLVADI